MTRFPVDPRAVDPEIRRAVEAFEELYEGRRKEYRRIFGPERGEIIFGLMNVAISHKFQDLYLSKDNPEGDATENEDDS